MSRRRLLLLGGGAAGVLAVGGGVLLLGGGGPGGPKGTAETFVRHMANDELEAANAMVHPDSPMGEIRYGAGISGFTPSIIGSSLSDEGDERATVRVDYKFSAGSRSVERTASVELRKHQGEWKVWAFDD